jgi:hypothetical protein
MPETVRVTFLYALGHEVCWAARPEARWRVIERFYREGEGSRYVRYRLRRLHDTEDAMADEADVWWPEEDEA